MEKDRTKINQIITNMLDNPDDCGIYPTSEAFNRLEYYIEQMRFEAIEWIYAYASSSAHSGIDIRAEEFPTILKQALTELSQN